MSVRREALAHGSTVITYQDRLKASLQSIPKLQPEPSSVGGAAWDEELRKLPPLPDHSPNVVRRRDPSYRDLGIANDYLTTSVLGIFGDYKWADEELEGLYKRLTVTIESVTGLLGYYDYKLYLTAPKSAVRLPLTSDELKTLYREGDNATMDILEDWAKKVGWKSLEQARKFINKAEASLAGGDTIAEAALDALGFLYLQPGFPTALLRDNSAPELNRYRWVEAWKVWFDRVVKEKKLTGDGFPERFQFKELRHAVDIAAAALKKNTKMRGQRLTRS